MMSALNEYVIPMIVWRGLLLIFLFSIPKTSAFSTSDNLRPLASFPPQSIRKQSNVIPLQALKNSSDTSSRRSFLNTATASVWVTCASAFNPAVAHATYGQDAKMVMPDIVQGISDRTNKQCLVESLGNRECLVYLDPDNQLYKGSDAQILFERLAKSANALKDVPQYVDTKQWSKVLGVLTGPMGSLSSTMNELVKITESEEVKNTCKSLSVDIRKELYAIAGAVDRKNQKDALVAYEKSVEKLDKFVKLISA
mmetsp:Transcript_4685/g.9898  ORF Transcript_4685/g.9898 Transcript_4685/m.9898 type:complete len:254 (+) Transcript_4685:93-854(+)